MTSILPAIRSLKHCNFFHTKSKGHFLFLILFLTMMSSLHAQQVWVKGSVVRQNGEPLAGVSVVVKGTEKGTTTQTDGSFQIEAPSNAVLVISYIGFIGQDIKVSSIQPNMA